MTGDPAAVADEMGTSLTKIEKHYRNRSKGVTLNDAKDWFSILPADSGKILTLPNEVPKIAEPDAQSAVAAA
jgi:hypothetical protein